ncbi:uncharacterized protein LOC142317664 [Lycorma delicatula]|uniref:uncharacterized protein LOC142317664 n=1 Tax=Lycorma delicatula TaxID=130591 RepID=UPI003F50D711
MIPEQIQVKWTNYRNSLQILNHLSVDRRVASGNTNQQYELHGFSDASERAYGACFYLRTIQEDITVKLLCSKSRVAPLKSISLPRLELCGALLLAKLIQKIRNALDINIASITLWTDSTIVLHWLNSPPQTWQTYVRNRTSQIQDLTQNCTWMHIRIRQI